MFAAALLAALALAGSPAAGRIVGPPEYAGPAFGNSKVLVGFDLRGKDRPEGPKCFDNHPHVLRFGAVNTSYPNCPQILEGYFESTKAVPVGGNGYFESHEKGYNEADISFGGRFVDGGRRARGWFTMSESGCTTGRVRWKARLGG
jgi:hypothetical protein